MSDADVKEYRRRAEAAERERDEARAELTAAQKALADFVDHGVRHDLNPTHMVGDERFWHGYLLRLDAAVRERAAHALGINR